MVDIPSRETFLQLFRDLQPVKHLYLMGGFAEDALLDQRITRERADVDFLVKAESWTEVDSELQRLGIAHLEPLMMGPTDEPLAFGSSARGFVVEVWPAREANHGYEIVLPGGASFHRLKLPADTFDFAEITLQGIRVRTISPEALALFRATSAQTRGDETKRTADRDVMNRIVKAALPGHAASDMIPDLSEIRDP